jgi:nucleoside-diphosphate-sugar epimerase
MRIFVTGATGYIGLNVALALRRAGHEVWGLVRSPEKAVKLARHEIHPIIGALDDPASYMPVAERCVVFVHAAADASRDEAVDLQAVESLLSLGTKGPQPKTLVYTSGTWVYGNSGKVLIDEASSVNPVRLKPWRPAHENMVLGAANVRGLVIRPGCVFGRHGGMTSLWFKGPSKGESPFVVGDGRNRWAMIHVDDVANGYLKAVESGRSSEIFNLTDRSRASVAEMATAAARAAGYQGRIEYTPLEEATRTLGLFAECLALDQHIDSRKAVRILGWQPRHGGFIDSVDTYHSAWRAHQK